jgi:RNA polymerase sigma-70 factor (ECF subfamily)
VLREVFGYEFADIATTLGRSEAACRQLLVRARRHVEGGRARFEADQRARDELAARFFDAFRHGDVESLKDVLAADVQLVGDAGGKAPALGRVVVGVDKVARVIASLFPRLDRVEATLEQCQVNGQPGAILRDREGKVAFAFALDVLGGQVQTIRSVGNPDKLRHLGPVADAWALQREFKSVRED